MKITFPEDYETFVDMLEAGYRHFNLRPVQMEYLVGDCACAVGVLYCLVREDTEQHFYIDYHNYIVSKTDYSEEFVVGIDDGFITDSIEYALPPEPTDYDNGYHIGWLLQKRMHPKRSYFDVQDENN